MGRVAPAVTFAFGGALLLTAASAGSFVACKDNMFTGNLTPVPPVHRLPADVAGAVVLIDADPVIETRDPNHVFRANEQMVPQQYRAAMARALVLGGFRVTARKEDPHDLHAKLAIAVSENGEEIRQVYRCGLAAPDGAPIVQIDWAWPKGTFVDVYEVFDFATHHVATEAATSRKVLQFLRSRRPPDAPREGAAVVSEDAGAPLPAP